MIDIWMLFTMTVPFLEVVLYTTTEVFSKSRATPPCLSKRVNVVSVKPAEEQEMVEEVRTGNSFLGSIASLVLPVTSLIFAFIFWTVGLIASYSDGNNTHQNMKECLAVQPN